MPHGYPDYGLARVLTKLYATFDLGEIPARLLGRSGIDRLGDVVWAADFSRGMNLGVITPTAGAEVTRVWLDHTITPGYCVRLDSAALQNATCGLFGGVWFGASSRIGLEWTARVDTGWASHDVTLGLTQSGLLRWGTLRYVPAGGYVRVIGSGATWTTLDSGVDLGEGNNLLHRLKLVIDYDLARFVRARIDGRTYDLTNVQLGSTADQWPGRIYLDLRCLSGTVGGTGLAYYGDVIATINEP